MLLNSLKFSVPRMRTSEPVIFLKGVKGAHLDKILKYIYSGSVSLSRHQLKPILEVAKSLQVKGLYDANPADILSRQGLTGPSPSGTVHFFKVIGNLKNLVDLKMLFIR